jgi:hypothetical protein
MMTYARVVWLSPLQFTVSCNPRPVLHKFSAIWPKRMHVAQTSLAHTLYKMKVRRAELLCLPFQF